MPYRRLQSLLSTDAGLTVLLASLFAVLFVIYPFVPLRGPGRLVVTLVLTLILVSGSFSLGDQRRLRIVVLALAGIALAFAWAGTFADSTGLRIWSHASTILFLVITAGGVLAKVMRPGRVTSHRIQGAVAVYLMLGLTWGFTYSLVELCTPGSFNLPGGGGNMRDFVYLSFVTLTTLGYGDVTPVSSAARTLAILEALIGQLYLVILIARLISLQVAHSDPETQL